MSEISLATLRIGIIEDEGITRDLLAAICEREFAATVVLRAAAGREGLAGVLAQRPELLLLDLCLPDLDGLAVAATVRRDVPHCRVIVLSALRDPVTLMRIRELGLHGFVDKREQSLAVLRHAIGSILEGRGYFSPVMAAVLADLRRDPYAFHLVLSPHEQRILVHIGNSRTDDEIAAVTGLRPATVQSRRRDIMRKLNIHSTPKLIHYANTMGFSRLGKYLPPAGETAAG